MIARHPSLGVLIWILCILAASCVDSEPDGILARQCPEGWTYEIADGVVRVDWRDYCLSPDGATRIEPATVRVSEQP